jgi:hypothetical protein
MALALLRRMLAAGFSRYHLQPLQALTEAEEGEQPSVQSNKLSRRWADCPRTRSYFSSDATCSACCS